ncbi:MAG: DUF711 family protein [Candidatus Promineifilaceae bacterium]
MKIRSITLFAEPSLEPERAGRFFDLARNAFPEEVQTLRLATTPYPTWWNRGHYPALQARENAEIWAAAGAEFVSLGPVLLRHDAGWLELAPEIVAAGHGLCVAAEIADASGTIDVGRCRAVAGVIRRLSMLAGDGSANFYFAALANCGPGVPFFPAAYHQGGSPRFAIAVEAADLILESIRGATTLMSAQQALQAAIEGQGRGLTASARHLASETGVTFSGIDSSPAPALPPGNGLVEALEALGVGRVGAPGALFAAAFVADVIGRSDFQHCGFSGLMLPVLEDEVLARRAAAGLVTVNDLLTYAAVCGAGLDTVPLPGDISQDTLCAILLDVAALAVRLDKPLTARLMPMPGLAAGDALTIDLPQVIQGRVMAVQESQGGSLRQITRLQMSPYHSQEE